MNQQLGHFFFGYNELHIDTRKIMGTEYKILENENLNRIQQILIPQDSENDTFTIPPSSSSSKSSSITNTTSSTEFIPHIFYTLYQIQKDPNNSNNQLENKTGLIRHRLRNCKNLIKENDNSIELLSKSTEEWEQFITNRENELQIKKNVLLNLRGKISDILTRSNYVPKKEESKLEEKQYESNTENEENHVKIENSTENKEDRYDEVAIDDSHTDEETKPEVTSEIAKDNEIDIDTKSNDTSAANNLPANNELAQQFSTLTKDDENDLDDFDMEL